jgi:hypothetical protein
MTRSTDWPIASAGAAATPIAQCRIGTNARVIFEEASRDPSSWFLRHLVLAMVSAWSGALFGLAVQLMSNALQKLPLMRRPWEHVLFAAGGAFVGHKLGDLEVELTQRIEAHRANQKRPGS